VTGPRPGGDPGGPAALTILQVSRRPLDPTDPWVAAIREAIDPRHRIETFDAATDPARQFRDADVVIDFGGAGSRSMADVAKGVRLWQLTSVGTDHLDVDYFTARGIPVAHCPGSTSAVALAECALLLILAVSRQLGVARQRLAAGGTGRPMGDELPGRRLGLVGFGHSARELALRAAALGMRVSAIGRTDIDPAVAENHRLQRAYPPGELDLLISGSDVLSLHLPLTPATERIINRRRLGLLPAGAALINVSRGALVDETALLDALDSGRLAGAGLDAWASEPPSPQSALVRHPRVVGLPHIAGVTVQTARRRAQEIAANIERVAAGIAPQHLAAPQVGHRGS
jgi:phosphoglycerate dehydrogenase-like enzyme